MAENGVAAARTASRPGRPTITLPPRENLFFDSTTFSPGPMTLVSSLFSDTGCQSFSQLLAGAMASPAATATSTTSSNSFLGFGSVDANSNTDSEKSSLGFKQNRPVSLSIGSASSPLFMIPPGLSPSGFLNSPAFFSSYGQSPSPFGMSHQQALAQVTAQANISQSSNYQSHSGYQPTPSEPADSFISNSSAATNVTAEQQMQLSTMDANSPVIESSEVRGSDSKFQSTSIAVDKPAADGYNWRKYGQKQVKGSVFPRSYYKCTQIGCPVKKKVERSVEGQVIEIIYKGQHNHELPRLNGRGKDGDNSKDNAQIKPEVDNPDNYSVDNKPAGLLKEVGHDSSQLTLQLIEQKENREIDDKSDTKEESHCASEEQNPKRRKAIQSAPSQKTVTESRIVVQTRSEVDLLDDGFKWRKYGQKVVKGNPHPRSYYKCTTPGCSVRKHIERAAADPKAVITTYEGKHTHDIPLGKHTHASQLNPVKTAAQQTLPFRN